MKKLLILLLTIVLYNMISCTFVQASTTEADDIDKQLAEMGTPTQLLNVMTKEQKELIISEGLKFESYSTESKILDTGSNLKTKPGISPAGTISSSKLSLYFSIYSFDSSYGTKGGRRIMLNYAWQTQPTWCLTDELALAWNGDKYLVQSNSFKRTSNVYYQGKLHSSNSSTDVKEVTSNGAVWDIPMKSCENDIYLNTGFVSVVLLNRTAHTSSDYEQCFAKYLHKLIIPTVNLSITSPVAIGVEGVGTYDTLGIASSLFLY